MLVQARTGDGGPSVAGGKRSGKHDEDMETKGRTRNCVKRNSAYNSSTCGRALRGRCNESCQCLGAVVRVSPGVGTRGAGALAFSRKFGRRSKSWGFALSACNRTIET